MNGIDIIQKNINYVFTNPSLLRTALIHKSYSSANNERLEFLGDSLLNFIVTDLLYKKFPTLNEGQLSRLRASLVNRRLLAKISADLNLNAALVLGKAEKTSRNGCYILADAVEAVIGAIFLDSDITKCYTTTSKWYAKYLVDIKVTDEDIKDNKSRLQELMQARKLAVPIYKVIKTTGADHKPLIEVGCTIQCLKKPIIAASSNKRIAEQKAAGAALNLLKMVNKNKHK